MRRRQAPCGVVRAVPCRAACLLFMQPTLRMKLQGLEFSQPQYRGTSTRFLMGNTIAYAAYHIIISIISSQFFSI